MQLTELSIKEIAFIATFGALWGVSEITLGMLLHNFHVPFTGLILTIIGTIIALVCLRFTGRKRTIIYVALIAAALKMLSFTTFKFGPVTGIMMSAILGQTVIYLTRINLPGYILAAGAMCMWPFLQLLMNQLIIYTPKVFIIYQQFLAKIGIPELKVWMLIAIVLLIHFILGSITGFTAWRLSNKLTKKAELRAKTLESS
jgi:hypothetical protein